MSKTKNNTKSGIWIILGIIAFLVIAYSISPEGKSILSKYKNSTTTTSCSNTQGGCGGGCPMMKNFQKSKENTTPTNNTVTAEVAYETVNLGHTAYALNPETVTLSAGKSYKLIITPTENGGGCMSTMTIPGLDEKVYPIKTGDPITIIINDAKAGNYDVVCGAMGMYQGTIIIQ